VKIVIDMARPHHADIVWQIAIGTEQPATVVARARCIEMNDLPAGMNASVSAASTRHLDCVIGNPPEGFFDTLLHTEAGLLPLPAIVRGAVVLNTERDAHVD
jgi:hypothetical protein